MKRKKPPEASYIIAVGKKYVSRFTYPESITKVDKSWEKSEGVKIAPCCKAILGDEPFRWPHRASAEYCAQEIKGAKVLKLVTALAKAGEVAT